MIAHWDGAPQSGGMTVRQLGRRSGILSSGGPVWSKTGPQGAVSAGSPSRAAPLNGLQKKMGWGI